LKPIFVEQSSTKERYHHHPPPNLETIVIPTRARVPWPVQFTFFS
jgi:hypothetical protein